MHPIVATILLVEDRIAEILEDDEFKKYDSKGNFTEKTIKDIEALRNFKNLSKALSEFYKGV